MRNPAKLVPAAFLVAILIGTGLLMLPISRADAASGAPFLTALFTATSAVCVTGLIVVDTPTYWSPFGQTVILILFQFGGFGIMSGATLLVQLVIGRLTLGNRLVAQAETRSFALGDVLSLLRLILVVTLVVESATAAALLFRFHYGHGEPWGEAAWNGLFQAVSAFNNAGFSTYSDSMVRYATDPLVAGPIIVAVILGGVGFPVVHELFRKGSQPGRWSVHTKITLAGTALLLVTGLLLTLLFEWGNSRTLGPLDPSSRLLAAGFHSAMARTAGFNSVDVGAMRPETLAITYVLMMIGGGSAGTAGGIKVSTFLVLGYVVWAEIRGENDATVFNRRIPEKVQREALAIVLLAVGLVGTGTLLLLAVSEFGLQETLFEAISAFATVGLSTGITARLPPPGQVVLIVLMFVGRVGTITIAAVLALRSKPVSYRYPEERPIVG
jgi:trk system potassium uptake protein TrkH